MMILLDVGNTRIKWGFVSDKQLKVQSPIEHAGLTQDDLYEALISHFDRLNLSPDSIWIAHVASSECAALIEEWAMKEYQLKPHWIQSSGTFCSIQNAYTDPTKLGVDRLLGMLSAKLAFEGPLCVINCGTAVTLDAMDAHHRHVGGLIIPGLNLMRQSVSQIIQGFEKPNAPQELPCPTLLATDTYHGIWGGTALTLVSAIEKVQTELHHHFGNGLTSVISGGDAEVLLPLLNHPPLVWEHKPHLVLEGMWAYIQQQTKLNG